MRLCTKTSKRNWDALIEACPLNKANTVGLVLTHRLWFLIWLLNIRASLLENRLSRFSTWSDTNQAVQPHKIARGLKFRIYEVEGLLYLCSENKGADQLRGYRESDLRLCFRICKKPVFSRCGSYGVGLMFSFLLAITKIVPTIYVLEQKQYHTI